MRHITMRILSSLPVFAAALLLGACDDPTEVEDHFDVEGIAIEEEGSEIYRYMLDDDAIPTLTLTQGTHDVAFVLLDHDGEPLVEEGHEDGEEEHVLDVTIEDIGLLTWTPEEHSDAHEFIEFHGELDALQAGSTQMTLCVPHGPHCDFEVEGGLPVTITAP